MSMQFKFDGASRVLCGFLLLIGPCLGQAPQAAPTGAVATVDGQTIPRSQISVGDNTLKAWFHRKYGRYPGNGDEATLAGERTAEEQKKLAAAIKSKVRSEVLTDHGITVSDAEVLEKQRELSKGASPETLAQQKAQVEPLIQALKAVQGKQMTGDEAYQKFLAKSMPYDSWLIQEDTYSNPAMMKALELLAGQTLQDLQTKPDDGVRIMLIGEKVGQIIDADRAAQNPAYREYLDAVKNNDLTRIKYFDSHNPKFREKEQAVWWADRIAKAKIEILDPHLSGARDLLVATPEAK